MKRRAEMKMDGWSATPVLIGGVAALLVLAMTWKVANVEHLRQLGEVRASVVKTVGLLRARLEAAVNSHVYLTEGLRAHVAVHPDIGREEFQAIASQLMDNRAGIRSIQLARNSVVSHLYPSKGGEFVLGLQLLSIPEQRETVERTLRSGKTVIAGPVDLVQGGVAFISRTPIYLPPGPDAPRGEYWGLATVLVDKERLFEIAGFKALSEDLRIALRGKDGLGENGDVFFGDASVFDDDPITAEISIPNGTWQLAAVPRVDWSEMAQGQEALRLIGILLGLFVGLITGMLVLRTQTLMRTNRLLDEARATATLTARDRSRFLAAASHDLRQPLHALSIFISELEERARHHQWNLDLVERIRSSADALNELFHGLMDISRLDAGVVTPNFSEVPLHPLLERLAVENAPAAAAKGLRLRVVATRAVVRSDATLLECLLRNLLVNAIKYTESGGVLIGCRREGERVRIEVWDTGVGIPEAEQSSIFNEFYQLGNPGQDSRKGLGLGLAVVQRTAVLLGHHLEMRSCYGRGSLFSVSLPRSASPPPAEVTEIVADGYTLRDITVLVVDDDAIILEATRRLLERWGCRVLTAATGAEALMLVEENDCRVDILLCDYHLPGYETGDDVVRRLWERVGADVPAFLITGDTSGAVARQCDRIGCRLLAKPLAPAKLRAVVMGVVRKKTAIASPMIVPTP